MSPLRGYDVITESWEEMRNDEDLWCPDCGTKLIGSNVTSEGVCTSCLRTARWKEHTVNDGGVPPKQIPAWTFLTEALSFTIVDHGDWWSLHCPELDSHEELDVDSLGKAKTLAMELLRNRLTNRLDRIQAAIKELDL